MDRLTLMRSFVGVTKSRSFSQAARTLGISGSLVSRHVAELERTWASGWSTAPHERSA
jgi:DNA-binding transcriptional LysR family regulator